LVIAEGDDAMPVLKPDRARGLEARRGEAREFVEEEAAARIDPAFRHELKATPGPLSLCGIIVPHLAPIDRASQGGRIARVVASD
jgi:hypothetical protein